MEKSLGNTDTNTTQSNVKDVVFWGDGGTFKLISKASSKAEGWMKSTKAMEIEGVGCVVQVTTQQLNDTLMFPLAAAGETIDFSDRTKTIKHSEVAEALTFVPGVKIEEIENAEGEVISRKLVSI